MGAYSTPDEGLAAIRNVTVDDVNRVARTYMLNETAITGLLVPNTSGTPEVIAENFKRSSESFKIKAPKPVKLPAWAQSVMKMPVVANLPAPPADMCLANGLRLIVEHTGNSSLVTLSGSIKHTPQLQTPRGKEGLSDLLDHVMLQGGSTSLDQAQFRAAIYDIGADAAPGTVFSLKVPLDQLERGVALLADAQLHPALPEKVFRISQKKFTDIYRGLKNSPELARDHAYMEAILPKGDPLLHYETAESISKLTLQDLREHHAAVFRPDLTTIVMTGNIKPDRARAIVERYFGAWRAAGPKPDTEFPPIPDNKPLSIMVTDDSSRQADVVLAQSSKLNRAHPDYYPFLLGLNVLSGSAASRLNQSLRENRGLVYAVEADFSAGRTRSFFTVSYGTAPRNVAKVRTLIERDIETMRNTPVAQADLDQARNTMVRQLELLGTSIDSVVTTLLELAHDDLPLDLPAQAARKVQKITPQQVQAAFRRWIRPGGFVQVTSGPKPSTAGKRQGLH
jgi:zinc protease